MSNWRDTVMSDKEIEDIMEKAGRDKASNIQMGAEWVAKTQAELSFKMGMREVIEWINTHIADAFPYAKEEWQAQLRKWGIE